MPNKNDEIELYIDGCGYEGEGVGRFDGMAVFVPYAAKGDTALVRIVKTAKTHMFGKLMSVITPSESRTEAPCPVYGKCGGCSFMHLKYEKQLEYKRERVADCIKKICRSGEIEVLPVIPSDKQFFYRNKVQLPIGTNADGEPVCGFYAPHSHRIVPCTDCMLQDRSMKKAVDAFLIWMKENGISAYNEENGKGLVRHIFLRCGEFEGKSQLVFMPVITSERLPKADSLEKCLKTAGVTTLCVNINKARTNVILGDKTYVIYGDGYIKDVLLGNTFKISPQSFYQVNKPQAEKLYRAALDMAEIKKADTVYDLYCGAGTITLSAAAYAAHVYGIEIVEEAVKNAKENAMACGIDNVTFLAGDVAKTVRELKKTAPPNIVILDPPRKGCSSDTLELIKELCPEKIVYVSCNPATLARDMEYLIKNGYTAGNVQPVDLFPQTAHVETIVLLQNRNM